MSLTAPAKDDTPEASKKTPTADRDAPPTSGQPPPVTKKETPKVKRIPIITIYFTHRTRRPPAAELAARQKWANDNQVPRGFKNTAADKATLGPGSSLYGQALIKPAEYAAKATTLAASHPSEMTEDQWSSVLRQNRLSHGTYYRGITVKSARYPGM
jgi:hypothetical protein